VISNPEVQRLDVRTLAEFSDSHIPGSLNINVLDDSFMSMADSLLSKEKPVALYCRSGKRSRKAAGILAEKGYKVYNLDKGFESWTLAGKETVK
jgi:rhodanese-related sulfurtransferase